MTRARFLNDLYRLLAGNGMKAEQAEQHLVYYAEMLADRIEEGMSEDQAVASMESVETIARRVLEEEGLAYRPMSEIPVMPPAYPDASKLGGGGGKRAYQAPKKWSRRKIAQAVLWTVAVGLALGAISRWLLVRNVARHSDRPVVESTDYAVSEPVQEAPYAWEYEEGYDWDMPYTEGYEYEGSTMTVDASEVSSIDIQWAAGTVYVRSGNESAVVISEYSTVPLNERTTLHTELTDGELTIRFRANGASLGNVKGNKWLTVLVPDSILEELDIETTSANVRLMGLEQRELDVSTTSGEVYMDNCYLQAADVETISGDVNVNTLYADELDVSTTSGDISGYLYNSDVEAETISGDIYLNAEENISSVKMVSTSGDVRLNVSDESIGSISAHTTSGYVTLSLPYDLGFTLDYSTVSGNIANIGFDTVVQDGKIVYNGGGCEIEVETVSGDLDIY